MLFGKTGTCMVEVSLFQIIMGPTHLSGSPISLSQREFVYISPVHSTMEYWGAIWDTTVKEECDRLEIVQRQAAYWAHGTKGIISVTALLKDLDWLPLADRRQHQRLCLFYKIINCKLQVSEHTVNIKRSKSRTRRSNSLTLVHESGRDKHSPYWKGTILRTIPQWNRLSVRLQLTRLPPSRVGWALHHSAPSVVRTLPLPRRPVPVCHWSTCGQFIKTRHTSARRMTSQGLRRSKRMASSNQEVRRRLKSSSANSALYLLSTSHGYWPLSLDLPTRHSVRWL